MTTHTVPQALPITGGRWRTRAACADAPPELFDWQHLSAKPTTVPKIKATARLWCADCPVRAACRAEAERHEYVGIWGAVWFNMVGRHGSGTAYDLLTGERVRDGRRRDVAA